MGESGETAPTKESSQNTRLVKKATLPLLSRRSTLKRAGVFTATLELGAGGYFVH